MAEKNHFKRWSVSDAELEGMTPLRARDLMIRCFFEAQKETFARTRKEVGLGDELDKVEQSVRGAIRAVFKEVGANFERPTPRDFEKVLVALTERAASWGTPEDVVEFHRAQILKVVGRL